MITRLQQNNKLSIHDNQYDKKYKYKFFINIENILSDGINRNLLLKEAIENEYKGEILPYLQEIYIINNKKNKKRYEILFRYNSKEHNNIEGPYLLEGINNEISDKILLSMLKKVLLNFNKNKQDLKNIELSLNFRTSNVLSESLFNEINKLINTYNIKPENIIIEILEEVEANDDIIKNINKYKELGYIISMDDFGSKHSNSGNVLYYTYYGLLDNIKIDKGFFDKYKNTEILGKMIDWFNLLNLKITIEGIENEKDIELLKDLNISHIQGYYYSKPENYKKIKTN